jgi:hypothetical protein
VTPANSILAGGENPPGPNSPNPPNRPPAVRAWYIDDIVVTAFALLGFGGAVLLPLRYNVPAIEVSFLLATGLAALTYRYLGGIEGASFAVGALKLTGTLGALVGIAMLINSQLDRQSAQVWDLHGNILDERKVAIDPLQDADFSVFPGARAGKMGDFHVEFIRHPTQAEDKDIYLTVIHRFDAKKIGNVTIPLEISKLREVFPDATVSGNHINIDHIILPVAPDPSVAMDKTAVDLSPQQRKDYATAAQSARPASPNMGGVPQ